MFKIFKFFSYFSIIDKPCYDAIFQENRFFNVTFMQILLLSRYSISPLTKT